jgi:hypothetical protein
VKQAIAAVVVAALAVAATVGCGKKGPPLPPLVRLPAPPDVRANRRGSTVELAVVVPAANTDGSRPANISRVDIYALTGSPKVSDADLLKQGTRLASLPVKAPRNPDDAAEPGEPIEEVEAPTGNGLDQGAVATVRDDLRAAALVPADLRRSGSKEAASPAMDGPMLGPSAAVSVRTYVGVGINTKGKRGRLSRRASVSLALAPPAPSSPVINYDEKTITVTWTTGAPQSPPSGGAPGEQEPLASHPIGPARPAFAYNVYDTTTGALLTSTPVDEPRYTDARIEWGAERCYAVRAVDRSDGLSVESDAREPRCRKLVDTFPPGPPKDLKAVSSEGVISLIWDANPESDLAGYLIFRAQAPSDQLEPVVSAPLLETSFTDKVQSGTRYVYAVKAVDKAGNASAFSDRVEETAH